MPQPLEHENVHDDNQYEGDGVAGDEKRHGEARVRIILRRESAPVLGFVVAAAVAVAAAAAVCFRH